jgi:outer membrane protein OmpA-like peptidoglycan-associated protein
MADRDDLSESFLALVDEAFGRLLDEPDAHVHVSGFTEGT